MENTRVTANFMLSEFGGVFPDVRLSYILQWLRDYTGASVVITDAGRTITDHIAVYQQLEEDKKIPTLANGLGVKPLIQCIPWGSRHLPCFHTNKLRAVDIQCRNKTGNLYTGSEVYKMLQVCLETEAFKTEMQHLGYAEEVHIGVGVGAEFIHLDIDREKHTVWGYKY